MTSSWATDAARHTTLSNGSATGPFIFVFLAERRAEESEATMAKNCALARLYFPGHTEIARLVGYAGRILRNEERSRDPRDKYGKEKVQAAADELLDLNKKEIRPAQVACAPTLLGIARRPPEIVPN